MKQHKQIRFCYRKIIGVNNQHPWEQLVFDSSYAEFRMQAQFYNPGNRYHSFAEILLHQPAAEKLHFLVSAAVTGYIQQLNGRIPGVLNTLGRHFMDFSHTRFEIIHSDIHDREQHQVAINFFSVPMIWHETIGDQLLVSDANIVENEEGVLTNLVQLLPFLSVYSLKSN